VKNPISISFIFRNFWYKLSSLGLAVLVWGIVQGDEVLEINRRVKVNFSVANGYMVKGKSFRYIEAKLRGPRVLMGDYTERPLEAKIYIPSGQTGELEIAFEAKFIRGWDDRIKITPRDSYISVFVDEKVSRTVPIREVLQGAPAEGYFIEKVILAPDKVKLSGTKSDMNKLVDVVTEPIDIAGINQTKTVETHIVTQGLQIEDDTDNLVKVTLQVGDSKVNKRFASIPVRIVGSSYQATTKPKNVSIVIQGTPGILNFVNPSDLRAFVETTDLAPGRHEREIQVKIPPDTVLIETVPDKAVVEISTEKRLN